MTTTGQTIPRAWAAPTGLAGVLTSVDHKVIGKRYITTSFIFFLLGGIQAMVMRAQLAVPENTLVTPEVYNQLFTMHGTTMIFFFATPILFGFGNYLLPLMIGARDMAFPRLNAFGYWVFLFAGIFIYSSYLVGMAPDGGWFNYVPLTTYVYSPALNIDFYALGLLFLGISTTAGAINFIVTLFLLRAPGMSINRMPLFCWTILATSFAVIFAYPTLNVANILLELDRKFGMHFYDPAAGGHVLLWQHLFWFFGHPDVYIIFLPAAGMVSGDHRHLLPPPGRRLHGAGAGRRGHCHHQLWRLGPPHVRRRAARRLGQLLQRRHPGHHHSRRHPDLCLDRHALGRPAGLEDARSSLSSVSSSSLSSAASAASCSPSCPLTSRSPTATSWSRTFTTS